MPRRKQTQPMQRRYSEDTKESEERLSETGDLDDLVVPGVESGDCGEAVGGCQKPCPADEPDEVDTSKLTFTDASDLEIATTSEEQLSAGEEGESGSDLHLAGLKGDFFLTTESPMHSPNPSKQNTHPGCFLENLRETSRIEVENEKENMTMNSKVKMEKTEKLPEHENNGVDQPLNDIQMKRLCLAGGGELAGDRTTPCPALSTGSLFTAESSSTSTVSSASRNLTSSIPSFAAGPGNLVNSSRQSSVKQLESFVASVECRDSTSSRTTAKVPVSASNVQGICTMPVAALQSRKCKSSRLKTHAMNLPRLTKQTPRALDSMGHFVAVSQNCDPNQPLDLSVKTRPSESRASENMYLSYSCSQDFTSPVVGTSGSSLADLEKKFGNTSAIFDRIGTKTWASPFCGALVSRLGVNLYHSKLHGGAYGDPGAFGINVIPVPVQRFNSTQAAPAKSDVPLAVKLDQAEPGNDMESTGESRSATGPDPGFQWHTQKHVNPSVSTDPQRKLTNFQCSCGAELETLYHLTMHLQQTGHAPNKQRNVGRQEYSKLVRGQDMWLNHGCEQTRQILRCMECDESFKSLPELTVHMIQTKHYANIVGTDTLQKKTAPPSKICENPSEPSSDEDEGTRVHCLVCHEPFDGPEALGTHIVESGHYKKTSERRDGRADISSKELSSQSGRSWQNSRSMTPVGPSPPQSGMDDNVDYFDAPPCKAENDRKRYHSMSESSSLIDDYKETELNHGGRSLRCSDSEDVPMKYKRFDENGHSSFIGPRSPFDFKDNVNLVRPRSPAEEDSLPEETNLKSPGLLDHLSGRTDAERSSGRLEEDQVDPSENSSAFQVESFFRPSSNSSSDGSAIRAMETFIQKSFGSSEAKHRLPALNPMDSTTSLVGSLMTRFGCYADPLGQPAPGRPETRTSEALENSKNLYQNKYLPPVYTAPLTTDDRPQGSDMVLPGGQFLPAVRKIKTEAVDITPKRESNRFNHGSEIPNRESASFLREVGRPGDAEKLGKANRRRHSSQRQDQASSPEYYGKSEADSVKRDRFMSGVKSNNPVDPKSSGRTKGELNEVETDDRPSSTSNNNLSRSSALESLQGLVYGKALNTEHPLDSLQKLIYGRGGSVVATRHSEHLLNGSHGAVIMKGSDALHHSLPPGTLILVNPIVTVVPGASGSNPSLNITLPGRDSSPRVVDDRGKFSDLGISRRHRSPTDDRENSIRVYRCRGCRRKFSSKGSYRYHLSRCHVLTSSSSTSSSSEKRPLVTDPLRKSPYICMPLDATAKFNRYYQLASELGTEAK